MMLLTSWWADLVAGLTFSADALIVMPAEARVDVSSDNTTRIAVSLPTTAP
jgi:hypothetical protein